EKISVADRALNLRQKASKRGQDRGGRRAGSIWRAPARKANRAGKRHCGCSSDGSTSFELSEDAPSPGAKKPVSVASSSAAGSRFPCGERNSPGPSASLSQPPKSRFRQ